MNKRNDWSWAIAAAIAAASGFSMVSAPVFATENAQERRGARDTKQDARQTGRSAKVDCRQANNQSNSECRKDNRDGRQTGRSDSRDVRSGQTPAK
jgi:hypothetical protein